MARCPYCSSTSLVWDEFYGNVVCSSCGAVVAEHLLDDRPQYAENETRQARREQRALRGLPRLLEEARADPLASVVNKKALGVLRSSREVYEILVEITKHPLLKPRKLRVRVALALYLYLRLSGYSKSRAVKEASRKAGASERSLEKTIRAWREVVIALEHRISSKQLKLLEDVER
ncbi:MAG: TFIIB-type zinc ribbon-containing protein [Acidilobaceae archaeon]